MDDYSVTGAAARSGDATGEGAAGVASSPEGEDDPVRGRVLCVLLLVCLGDTAARFCPELGSLAARVTVALAMFCAGWLIGCRLDAAPLRRPAGSSCRSSHGSPATDVDRREEERLHE